MLLQLQSNSAEVKFHTSMKISTRADLVQRLLWQRVNQGVFCQTGWVWDDSVKKQCPGWHCRISLKKVKQTGLTQYLSKCKEFPGPNGLHTAKADWVLLAVTGARRATRSSEGRGGGGTRSAVTSTTLPPRASSGNLGEMHAALNHPALLQT